MIVQDTGFGAALPTGEGLFAFADLDEAAEAVATVQADPARHRRAAREVAREYLSDDVVLGNMLDHVGLRRDARRGTPRAVPVAAQPPDALPLAASSTSVLEPPQGTAQRIFDRPAQAAPPPVAPLAATVVVPVLDDLACTRLAVESILASTDEPPHEVVVVDIGCPPPTRDHLESLAAGNHHVRVIRVERELGFVGGCNQGLAAARADNLVVLEDDGVLSPGWLSALTAYLHDPAVGLVSAVANGSKGEAPSCVALRRDVYEAVGPLDERAEIDAFEDYAHRVRESGHRVARAGDISAPRYGAHIQGNGHARDIASSPPAPDSVRADSERQDVAIEAPPEEARAKETAATRPRAVAGLRSLPVSWIALGALLVAAAVILLLQTSGSTFWFDEWDWVGARRGGSLDTLLKPHNEHFSLVPVVVYKLLFATAGLDDYTVYRVVVTLAHLGCVALLFEYARRRVGPALALVAAALILFLGPGWQVILWPFEVAWLISIGAGVAALLTLDREDRTGDVAACALLTLAVASSGIGLPIVAGVLVESLARRRLRRRLWIVAIPLLIYLAWRIGYHPRSNVTGDTLDATPRFVARSVAASVSSVLGLGDFTIARNQDKTTTLMWASAAGAVVLLALRLARLRMVPVRVLCLLATLVCFWVLTGASRALLLSPNASRYVYIGAFFVVLVAVELGRGVRVPRWATAALGVAAIAAVVANFAPLQDGGKYLRGQGAIHRAALGALELARPHVVPGYRVRVVGPFVLLNASDYFAATDAFGSPAMAPPEIAASPEPAREAADRELIGAYGLRLLPAPAASRPGGRPTVEFRSGGTLAMRRGCEVLRARQDRPARVNLTVPPGGLLLDLDRGDATVVLRRFAQRFPDPGPVLMPTAQAMRVQPGALQLIRIPPDRAPRPWHAQVRARAGSVAICGLGPLPG